MLNFNAVPITDEDIEDMNSIFPWTDGLGDAIARYDSRWSSLEYTFRPHGVRLYISFDKDCSRVLGVSGVGHPVDDGTNSEKVDKVVDELTEILSRK